MNFFSCDREEREARVVYSIYQVNISSVNPLSDPTRDIRKLIYWLDKHWPGHGQPQHQLWHQQRFDIITDHHHSSSHNERWENIFNNSRKIFFFQPLNISENVKMSVSEGIINLLLLETSGNNFKPTYKWPFNRARGTFRYRRSALTSYEHNSFVTSLLSPAFLQNSFKIEYSNPSIQQSLKIVCKRTDRAREKTGYLYNVVQCELYELGRAQGWGGWREGGRWFPLSLTTSYCGASLFHSHWHK